MLRKDADIIIEKSIHAVLPDNAVKKALKDFTPGPGKTVLIAAGKAAWQMTSAAVSILPYTESGIVITKYGHVKAPIPNITCYEAGHPVPDENSFLSTRKAIDMVEPLGENDTVIFLLSGGGSALFESPMIPGEELRDITEQLLSSGADIVEINTIRKRFSDVKGGRFAAKAAPAKVFCIVLSDIIGDPLDMIASGPAVADSSTSEQAREIAEKYDLHLSEKARKLLSVETPKLLNNVTTMITGSVSRLCSAAADAAKELGYKPVILTDRLCCEAKEAGRFLSSVAVSHCKDGIKTAYIAGGETVVHIKGNGKGGRNQELALSAAVGLDGYDNIAVFSFGSDGTDGPTDAAGGFADGRTLASLKEKGLDIHACLDNNDSYHALKAVDSLIVTGPTGTNVNDVAVVLIGS